MARRAAAWYRRQLDGGKPTPALRSPCAVVLLFAGDCAQAIPLWRDLAREEPENLGFRGSYGVALALCGGSRAEAQRIADQLAKTERPFLKGAHHNARARVLVALGDREGSMRALETAFSQGLEWDGTEMHLNIAFRALRDYPPFVELMKPKG